MSSTALATQSTTRWSHIYDAVKSGQDRVAGMVRHTPVVTSDLLNAMLSCEVFLKVESYQRTGSFKFRGAYNRLAIAVDDGVQGIVAHSSGNFAQAVALAGKMLGLEVVIVMPDDAPRIKTDGVRSYDAEIVWSGRDSDERAKAAHALAVQRGWLLVEPYDDLQVIAGQATAAVELLEEVGELNALAAPLGGGGLLAGVAVATKHMSAATKVIGVEPAAMPKTALSISANRRTRVPVRPTVMDGQMITIPGQLTFPIIADLVDDVITIEDAAVVDAMRWMHERMKIVVEPSGAAALAALLSGKIEAKGRIGIILSGGNASIEQMAAICDDSH